MEITTLNASQVSKMFLAGAKKLEANKDLINELNVFPVPDGDTGTNMTMTIMSAAREVSTLETMDMKSVSKAISSGSLRGARGNSGVILSQLFRGFTKVIKKEEELTVDILCEACQKSVETAYRAVMKPKEGTILTVARAAADRALEVVDTTDDILVFTEEILKAADEMLQKTPDLLPVLKQAGVVDSGGQGLVEVLSGAYDFLSGKEVDLTIDGSESSEAEEKEEEFFEFLYSLHLTLEATNSFQNQDENEIRVYLEAIANDMKITTAGNRMEVEMLTNEPGRVINKALKYGSIHSVVLTNLRDDKASDDSPALKTLAKAEEKKTAEPPKEMGFVAVSIGEGMNQIFRDLGADYIIEGGQTMNPSTEDILKAIDQVNAKTVFVLPNNKNIVLAANQARDICEDKNIVVLPTKTLPQGITALINFVPDASVEDNTETMTSELANVKSGEITYAVRDTIIDDKTIKEGDYMGIGDAGIVAVHPDLTEVMLETLHILCDEDSSLISLYTGSDVTESDAEAMVAKVTEAFPNVEVELQQGGQPVYFYVLSVE
ncbi:MAG: DAK2 domain-containing protein [Lachnospiraceae bacterium]|nr:DAK2 domain-containing protein [Lachnospiraceae bacterium]MBQ1640810.1 DAK2 domain-containing protein [Lachnospiraceae bacterium]MBQ2466688.1 DAK2 domain-containing protein [Lachnospiraceae bacterium]MBQ2579641.1 DAK2 domain-containing protein [Lachnospiraceae bacterium]